jgi:hypothetical protein
MSIEPTNTHLSLKLDLLHNDVNDMKGVLRDLTAAINRLAVVEERQTQISTAMDRAFTSLEKQENRIGALERAGMLSAKTSMWVDKALWAMVLAGALWYVKAR